MNRELPFTYKDWKNIRSCPSEQQRRRYAETLKFYEVFDPSGLLSDPQIRSQQISMTEDPNLRFTDWQDMGIIDPDGFFADTSDKNNPFIGIPGQSGISWREGLETINEFFPDYNTPNLRQDQTLNSGNELFSQYPLPASFDQVTASVTREQERGHFDDAKSVQSYVQTPNHDVVEGATLKSSANAEFGATIHYHDSLGDEATSPEYGPTTISGGSINNSQDGDDAFISDGATTIPQTSNLNITIDNDLSSPLSDPPSSSKETEDQHDGPFEESARKESYIGQNYEDVERYLLIHCLSIEGDGRIQVIDEARSPKQRKKVTSSEDEESSDDIVMQDAHAHFTAQDYLGANSSILREHQITKHSNQTFNVKRKFAVESDLSTPRYDTAASLKHENGILNPSSFSASDVPLSTSPLVPSPFATSAMVFAAVATRSPHIHIPAPFHASLQGAHHCNLSDGGSGGLNLTVQLPSYTDLPSVSLSKSLDETRTLEATESITECQEKPDENSLCDSGMPKTLKSNTDAQTLDDELANMKRKTPPPSTEITKKKKSKIEPKSGSELLEDYIFITEAEILKMPLADLKNIFRGIKELKKWANAVNKKAMIQKFMEWQHGMAKMKEKEMARKEWTKEQATMANSLTEEPEGEEGQLEPEIPQMMTSEAPISSSIVGRRQSSTRTRQNHRLAALARESGSPAACSEPPSSLAGIGEKGKANRTREESPASLGTISRRSSQRLASISKSEDEH